MISGLKTFLALAKEAGTRMFDDQAPMMGAALAYYSIFSIAPLLVIAIAAAGVVFGRNARADLFDSLSGIVGAQSAAMIRSMVNAAAARPHAGAVATVIGLVTLLAGASGAFQQIQQSLNIIWKVAPQPGATWRILIRRRALSFGMVAVAGLVLFFSMSVSAVISGVGRWAPAFPSLGLFWRALNTAGTFTIVAVLFAAMFKILPDVRLSWTDVRGGGALTAVLFLIGKAAIGAYIGRVSIASAYGAAGSLVAVLLWVFISSQIIFFGAEFTRASVLRGGRVLEPKKGARIVGSPAEGA